MSKTLPDAAGERYTASLRDHTFADADVGWISIKQFCAMVEDGNPSYWDREFAERQWGGIIAPPALLATWLLPLQWKPGGGGWSETPPLPLRVTVPGDTIINVAVDTEFLRPVRLGDHLSLVEEVVEISKEKQTRLGLGYFITTRGEYRDQRGEVVGRNTNVLLRYASTPPGGPGSRTSPAPESAPLRVLVPEEAEAPADRAGKLVNPRQLYWKDVQSGDLLPTQRLDVTYLKVIMVPGTTRDIFPGHHNPDYARQQGQETIYINTVFFQGFIDRVVTDWAGPAARIQRRQVKMERSIYAGDTMWGRGRVVDRHPGSGGRGTIDLEVEVGRQDGRCATALVTASLPRNPLGTERPA